MGEAGFALLEHEFVAMKAFALRVNKCSWKGVPDTVLQTFVLKFQDLIQVMNGIRTFSVMRSGNVQSDRSTQINNFRTQWGLYYSNIVPHLCYSESFEKKTEFDSEAAEGLLVNLQTAREDMGKELAFLRNKFEVEFQERTKTQMQDFQKQINDSLKHAEAHQEALLKADQGRITKKMADFESDATSKLKQALSKQEEELKGDKERMTSLIEGVADMAKKGAISEQSEHFKKLANNYGIACIFWIAGALASGIILYKYVQSLHVEPAQITNVELVAMLMPRIITVTLLSSALIFFLRNFAAMMHNMVVNRHRQTALTTFKVFVNGTSDACRVVFKTGIFWSFQNRNYNLGRLVNRSRGFSVMTGGATSTE